MSEATFKHWKVDVYVTQNWVDDGFNLNEEDLKDAIQAYLLGYSHEHEVVVKVEQGDQHDWRESGGWYGCANCGVAAGAPGQTAVCPKAPRPPEASDGGAAEARADSAPRS